MLNQEEAFKKHVSVLRYFEKYPKRRVIRPRSNRYFVLPIRKDHLEEDLLRRCGPGVYLLSDL